LILQQTVVGLRFRSSGGCSSFHIDLLRSFPVVRHRPSFGMHPCRPSFGMRPCDIVEFSCSWLHLRFLAIIMIFSYLWTLEGNW
jgi:hypothetical protein